ncbi:MAG: hypothetical protein LBN27_05525 [Prevotellaceae bacterium]|jgi:hypothetical protein|nr:hypothetical protein [Prevotellaceae bacterium]
MKFRHLLILCLFSAGTVFAENAAVVYEGQLNVYPKIGNTTTQRYLQQKAIVTINDRQCVIRIVNFTFRENNIGSIEIKANIAADSTLTGETTVLVPEYKVGETIYKDLLLTVTVQKNSRVADFLNLRLDLIYLGKTIAGVIYFGKKAVPVKEKPAKKRK